MGRPSRYPPELRERAVRMVAKVDVVLLGLRLPGEGRPLPQAGSLAPDIARLLVAAGDPRPDDVFLDPFCGSGALVAARRELPYRRATGSDLSDGVDARKLPAVLDGSVHCIVTDPPWGEHDELDVGYVEFAGDMLASLDRVLNLRSGRLVMLVARRLVDTIKPAWARHALRVTRHHDVLINGHPSTVLVGGRYNGGSSD